MHFDPWRAVINVERLGFAGVHKSFWMPLNNGWRSLAAHMSGGEQQMLTVARTLMGNPSLILLDEPSEGLSPNIVEQVAQAIIHVTASGITVLLSEQNMHFASLVSERAYVIEKGQIKFSGTIDSLRSNDDIRRNYLAI